MAESQNQKTARQARNRAAIRKGWRYVKGWLPAAKAAEVQDTIDTHAEAVSRIVESKEEEK